MFDSISFDRLPIAAKFSGSTGQNRAIGKNDILADDDGSAVLAWLGRYADSPATYAAYRREVERLVRWCVLQRQTALSNLTHEDLELYVRFLADPQPAERWVMAQGQKSPRSSSQWRPFAGPLSPTSQRLAMSILNAMFAWLVKARYLAINPLAHSRQYQRGVETRVKRVLLDEHWAAVEATIEAMPKVTPRNIAHAARTRWLFSLLHSGALRVSEISETTMAGFVARRAKAGDERWWLEVSSKGGKTRWLPTTADLMAELTRYRRHLGVSRLPQRDDAFPLVASLVGVPRPLARSAIHEIVKGIMRDTAVRLRAQGSEFEAAAAHIEQASTHWLRRP